VEDRDERHRLLREAQQKGWGERELRRTVQQHKGSKCGGGRPRRQLSSQGPLADASELLRLTQLWLEFDREVWSHAGPADLRRMDDHARSNLSLMLEDAVQRLRQLQSRAKEARRVAESLLGESNG
jgi:hypothetical protein